MAHRFSRVFVPLMVAASPAAQAIGIYTHTMSCQTYYITQCYDSFKLVADRRDISLTTPLYLEYDIVKHTRHVDAEAAISPGQNWIVAYDTQGGWDGVPAPYGHIGQHMKVDISWMLQDYVYLHPVTGPLFEIYGGGVQWVDRPDNWLETILTGNPWYGSPTRVAIANMQLTQPIPEPETWAFLLAGLGVLASRFRGRVG